MPKKLYNNVECSFASSGPQVLQILPTLSGDMLPFEHLQQPGEVVFLPSGWWHLIINVEDTIAVTQNYVPVHSLKAAVCELAVGPAAAKIGTPAKGIRDLGITDHPRCKPVQCQAGNGDNATPAADPVAMPHALQQVI